MKSLCVTKNDHVYKLHRKTKFEIYAMFQELFDRETIRCTGDGYICCNLKSENLDQRVEKEKNESNRYWHKNQFCSELRAGGIK